MASSSSTVDQEVQATFEQLRRKVMMSQAAFNQVLQLVDWRTLLSSLLSRREATESPPLGRLSSELNTRCGLRPGWCLHLASDSVALTTVAAVRSTTWQVMQVLQIRALCWCNSSQ
jgi:hypothetical protein